MRQDKQSKASESPPRGLLPLSPGRSDESPLDDQPKLKKRVSGLVVGSGLILVVLLTGVGALVVWVRGMHQESERNGKDQPAIINTSQIGSALKSGSVRQINTSQLLLRNELNYAPNESEPYSGHAIEVFPTGQYRVFLTYESGKLHGECASWHENGQPESRLFYRNGLPHGSTERWYSDGTKALEAGISEGLYHGAAKQWFPNGQLAATASFGGTAGGFPSGIAKTWHPNGDLASTADYGEGDGDYSINTFYIGGAKYVTSIVKQGRIVEAKTYYPEGQLWQETVQLSDNRFDAVLYYQNGRRSSLWKLIVENGVSRLAESAVKGWADDGSEFLVGDYTQSHLTPTLVGEWHHPYSTKTRFVGISASGRFVVARESYPGGAKLENSEYRDGKLHKSEFWNSAGNLVFSFDADNNHWVFQ